MIIDWIKDGTSVEIAAEYALDFVSEKACELDLVEEWEDLWGRQVRNAQHRRGK